MINENFKMKKYNSSAKEDELFNYIGEKTGMNPVVESYNNYAGAEYIYKLESSYDYCFCIYRKDPIGYCMGDSGSVAYEDEFALENFTIKEVIELLNEGIKKIKLKKLKIRKSNINSDFK